MQRTDSISTRSRRATEARHGQPSSQVSGVSAKQWGQAFVVLIVVTWGASLRIGFESALAVLTGLGLLAAIAGLRRPALGMLGISVLATVDAPARTFVLTGGMLRFNTFNYWLLFVILLSLPFLLRIRNSQTRLLQAFILVLIVGLAFSSDLPAGAQHILNIATLFGLIVYFAYALGEGEIWYWMGLVCGSLSAIGGLPFYLQIDQLPRINAGVWAYFPLTGLFAIALSLPFALKQSQGRLTLGLFTLIALAGANLVWIFISTSRGVLLISLFFLAFLTMEIRGLSRRIPVFIVVALIAIFLSLQFVDLRTKAVTKFQRLLDPEVSLVGQTSGRSDLALAGLHIFRKDPLGIGTGEFKSAWADLGSLGGLLTTRHVGSETLAHSAWLRTLVENGVLGFFLLAAYVFSFALAGWRRSRQDPTLWHLGLLVTGALSIGFISQEFQGKGLWFLAAGVTVLLHRQEIAALRGLATK